MLLISQCQGTIYIFFCFVSIEVYGMEMHISFNINKKRVHLCLQSAAISFRLVYLFLLLFLHILLSCNVYPATDIKSAISIVSICLSCWRVFSPHPYRSTGMVVVLHDFKNDSFTLLLNIHQNIPHISHNKINKYTNVTIML